MTKRLLGIITVSFFISVLLSCNRINPKEDIPAFVRIDSITVNANAQQGTSSSNITEAWVYINGEQQGIYDLPVTIPILKTGTFDIDVRGGIKRDGISQTRIRYPFYDAYKQTVTLNSLDTLKLNPVLPYFSAITVWEENFEDPGIKLDKVSGSQTDLQITYDDEEVFEGNASGKIVLKDSAQFFTFRTEQNFQFPTGAPVFVELDYKTTADLRLGIYADGVQFNVLYMRSKKDALGNPIWNKIYINLTEYITINSTSSSFDIYLTHTSETTEEKVFYIDNLKVVYP